ncbi:MAG: exodeoxyribonuclease VII large subunit [Alphaproteobacteria bacterium]|jgi:exodeoxyribonuclease VII large subunit|nr:exodeoxyribonuclease VII large subunit [Alphaproteobacteria bacterium]HJP20789.1 exodeoxyribonuclease VII large subunit [Alphaproteobacteria bacterium]
MSETPPNAPPNVPEYSVGEISAALKRSVERAFERVRVRGEISGFKRAASGHLYMSLKDDSAVLDAVCWRGSAGRLAIAPEDGLEVIVSGKLTTYPARSRYQLVIDSIELAGEGALLKLLEERRRKLAAEGLFDDERKRTLPFLPRVIGVVSSPGGAVIRDILHRLRERFPRHVLLWPVLVQGDGAAEQITAAIAGFDGLTAGGNVPRPDLLIVARGGGSVEDLWAFNEEIVVRAAAACSIPLISAVGHETDTTLIDFAADRRAPTPTAAAEMAVPVRADLDYTLKDLDRRLFGALKRNLDEREMRLKGLARGLRGPRELIELAVQRLDEQAERLARAWRQGLGDRGHKLAQAAAGLRPAVLGRRLAEEGRGIEGLEHRLALAWRRGLDQRQGRLEAAERLLASLSHQSVLARGFALVHGDDGLLTSAAALRAGQTLELEFHDGRQAAVAGAGARPARPARKKKSSPADGQGELL